jgi:hypothetical protein
MVERIPKGDRFSWRLSICAAALAPIAYIATTAVFSSDGSFFLYILMVAPIVILTLLITAIVNGVRGRPTGSLSAIAALAAFLIISFAVLRNSFDIRARTRWLLKSSTYKAEVLGQPSSNDRSLKHVEWDGWGFAGSDTLVYLAYDPSDSLSTLTGNGLRRKISSLPCEVAAVRRLEKQYYAIEFYTDTSWDHCR